MPLAELGADRAGVRHRHRRITLCAPDMSYEFDDEEAPYELRTQGNRLERLREEGEGKIVCRQ